MCLNPPQPIINCSGLRYRLASFGLAYYKLCIIDTMKFKQRMYSRLVYYVVVMLPFHTINPNPLKHPSNIVVLLSTEIVQLLSELVIDIAIIEKIKGDCNTLVIFCKYLRSPRKQPYPYGRIISKFAVTVIT